MAPRTWTILITLAIASIALYTHPITTGSRHLGIAPVQPLDPPVHKTYWLKGDICCWNGTAPGPLLGASDHDTLTIMLLSNDTALHNWYLDFNGNDGTPDTNELPTRSPSTTSKTSWLNFTFTPFLGPGNYTSGGESYAGIPHGGSFTYRCQYHISMYGTFKFTAGPVAAFTRAPNTPLAGNLVSFDASSSWPSTDATITGYGWNFGDGNTASTAQKTTSHVYLSPGNYSVRLNVTDSLLQKASTNSTVRILNPPPTPFDYQISITPPNATIEAGNNITVSVTLTLVSGAPENVSISSLITPTNLRTSTTTSLSRTNGFPTFTSSLSINTTSSSLCYPDPCYLSGRINVTIVALTDTGANHNATFTLTLTPAQVKPAQNYLLITTYATIAIVGVVAGVLLLRRFRRKKP